MALSPSSSLATLRPDLGGSLMEFDLQAQMAGFVTLELLPVFETMLQAGPFGRIPLKVLLANPETTRAPGGTYGRGNISFDPDSYATVEHGWEEPIDDREAKMYQYYFDAEQLAALRARHVVLQALEMRGVALLLGTTGNAGATVAWTDTANAKPIDDVRTAALAIYGRTGLRPNKLCFSWRRFQTLKDCAQIIDRIKYSGQDPNRKAITAQVLAAVFDVDEVVISGAVKNTANEGQAAVVASTWDDTQAWLGRTAVTNDVREPCFGRVFHWGEDGSSIGGVVETYRDETRRSNIARCRMDTHEKVLFGDAGQRITGI